MDDEYKKRMNVMMGMSGVPWHSEKVPTKMLYIGTMNDGINDYMMN